MDQQNIILFGCLTLALAISAFILWGPSPRPRKKKCHIVGLVNLGSTCFLNTLLQALASCALFIQWLTQQNREENSLTSCLHEVLWVLNGDGNGDVHAPVEVLSALKRHGWMVPSGEQDAHELFHVIVSTLQEENKKKAKGGSLSDALPASQSQSQSGSDDSSSDVQLEDNEASFTCYSDANFFCTEESWVDKVKSKIGQGDDGELCSSAETNSCKSFGDNPVLSNELETTIQGDNLSPSSAEMYSLMSQGSDKKLKHCGDTDETSLKVQFDFANSRENNSVEKKIVKNAVQSSSQPGGSLKEKSPLKISKKDFNGCYDRVAKGSLFLPQADASPFQGLLTSTLQCSACGYYSSLHYDTFDSLSLPLGDNFLFQVVKLQDLLRKFVKTEIIPEVDCEKCCKKTTALKTMNFGKLPACLCLHIARTTWQSYSHQPTKRDDFVDFPEYLPMDEYTVSSRTRKTGSVESPQQSTAQVPAVQEKSYKYLYRLKSVVVHLGGVSSGHFLTYRRGALDTLKRHRIGKLAGVCKDNRRWYLTSDDNVKMSTLCEAMESLAYMLFYEKCESDMFSVHEECNKSELDECMK